MKYNNYVFANSLDEAYELNQKKNNQIIAGNGWLRLSKGNRNTLIDLSLLNLDYILNDDNEFKIGAMTTLRELELNEDLNLYTNNMIKNSLKDIVGTQFRNCATIGGSIYSRFGFSDVLTIFLTMDCYVKLYKRGLISLSEYTKLNYDKDIIEYLVIKKHPNFKISYQAFRNEKTDFPLINVAISSYDLLLHVAVGARPNKALLKVYSNVPDEDILASEIADSYTYNTNMRASDKYRHALAYELAKLCLKEVL